MEVVIEAPPARAAIVAASTAKRELYLFAALILSSLAAWIPAWYLFAPRAIRSGNFKLASVFIPIISDFLFIWAVVKWRPEPYPHPRGRLVKDVCDIFWLCAGFGLHYLLEHFTLKSVALWFGCLMVMIVVALLLRLTEDYGLTDLCLGYLIQAGIFFLWNHKHPLFFVTLVICVGLTLLRNRFDQKYFFSTRRGNPPSSPPPHAGVRSPSSLPRSTTSSTSSPPPPYQPPPLPISQETPPPTPLLPLPPVSPNPPAISMVLTSPSVRSPPPASPIARQNSAPAILTASNVPKRRAFRRFSRLLSHGFGSCM